MSQVLPGEDAGDRLGADADALDALDAHLDLGEEHPDELAPLLSFKAVP